MTRTKHTRTNDANDVAALRTANHATGCYFCGELNVLGTVGLRNRAARTITNVPICSACQHRRVPTWLAATFVS